MSKLEDLKSREVDYELIGKAHQFYRKWRTKRQDRFYQKVMELGIPLVNVFLSKANNRYQFEGGERVFEELHSYAYMVFGEKVREADNQFSEPAKFYSYFEKRLVFAIFDHYRDEFDRPTYDIEDTRFAETPTWESYNVSNLSQTVFFRYVQMILTYLPGEDEEPLRFLIEHQYKEGESLKPGLLEVKYDLSSRRAKRLVRSGELIYRICLLYALSEDKEPHRPMSQENGVSRVDKLFLILVLMEDKYPELSTLYFVLGDKLFDLISVMGEEKIKLPAHEDIMRIDEELDIVEEILNNPSDDTIDRVAQSHGLERKRVTYILELYKNRLGDVPALEPHFDKIDEVYGREQSSESDES